MAKIADEDVKRMKQIAEASLRTPPKELYHLEHEFTEDMAKKYGRAEAMRLLTKVWALSERLRNREAEQW